MARRTNHTVIALVSHFGDAFLTVDSQGACDLAAGSRGVYLGLMALDYQHRIIRDPAVCDGQPVIKGTRVTLRTVLASLAEGATVAEILHDFPSLAEEDVRAVIAFAAASAGEDLPLHGLRTGP